jgi:hypothetical protein
VVSLPPGAPQRSDGLSNPRRATMIRTWALIAVLISGAPSLGGLRFLGGAAIRREGGWAGSASGWSSGWRTEGVMPRSQNNSFLGFPGRPGTSTRDHRQCGRPSDGRRPVTRCGALPAPTADARPGPTKASRQPGRSSCGQYSTGLDERAIIISLFVLPVNEQQHVSLTSLVDAPDLMPRRRVRGRLVTG